MHPTTKSRKIVDGWLKDIDLNPVFINVSDEKTKDNKPLTKSKVIDSLPSLECKIYDYVGKMRIVALGDTASFALNKIGVSHLKFPHPSGLNRKINDIDTLAGIKLTLKQISLGIIP